MDGLIRPDRILTILKKYRYAASILVIGIILMVLPNREQSNQDERIAVVDNAPIESISRQLSDFLSKMEGAGRVEVFLTYANGEETVYQTNEKNSGNGENLSSSSEAVVITDGDRKESGLVRQVNPAKYLGAVILCQGADSPTLRYSLIEAVSKATGLSTDKITVMKMK